MAVFLLHSVHFEIVKFNTKPSNERQRPTQFTSLVAFSEVKYRTGNDLKGSFGKLNQVKRFRKALYLGIVQHMRQGLAATCTLLIFTYTTSNNLHIGGPIDFS